MRKQCSELFASYGSLFSYLDARWARPRLNQFYITICSWLQNFNYLVVELKENFEALQLLSQCWLRQLIILILNCETFKITIEGIVSKLKTSVLGAFPESESLQCWKFMQKVLTFQIQIKSFSFDSKTFSTFQNGNASGLRSVSKQLLSPCLIQLVGKKIL